MKNLLKVIWFAIMPLLLIVEIVTAIKGYDILHDVSSICFSVVLAIAVLIYIKMNEADKRN